jgi:predicted site-specific integrase-resolvase
MSNSKLLKVSTYARQNNVSVQTIYDKIKDGKLKVVIIDGVKFIRVE